MKKILIFLVIILILCMPFLLNNLNFVVNKQNINSFNSLYHKTFQTREASKLFYNSRFDGYTTDYVHLKDNLYYQIELQCSYNPKKTAVKLQLLKKNGKNTYSAISSLSFIGKLKDEMLSKKINETTIDKLSGLYAENISNRDAFNEIVRNKLNKNISFEQLLSPRKQ